MAAALRFIAACGEKRPALAIVDLGHENGRDGLDLIKDLKATYSEILTLVLSMHDESLYAKRAIKAGARGYLSKNQLDETILSAIHRVLAGGLYLSAVMGAKIAEKYLVGGATPSGEPSLGDLIDRQLEVFRLLGKGLSTREIAARLHLSPKTVESHREHIKQKRRSIPGPSWCGTPPCGCAPGMPVDCTEIPLNHSGQAASFEIRLIHECRSHYGTNIRSSGRMPHPAGSH